MPQSIRDVMTTQPVVLGPEASISEAARRMKDSDIGNVLVAYEDGTLGLVTDRDIVVRGLAEGRPDARLADIASGSGGGLVALRPDETVDEALRLMRGRAIRRLPVVEDGKPIGIVSIGDLAARHVDPGVFADIAEALPNW